LVGWVNPLDDPEVSQHFLDWYTYKHVLHGIMIYFLIWAFAKDRLSVALGLLIAVSFAAVWEILENAPPVVDRYAKITLVSGYAGDAVVNSAGDMLATIAGFLAAALSPRWVTAVLFFAGLLFPNDNLLILG
jgi:hypothetical protein